MPESPENSNIGKAWYELVSDDSLRQGDIFRDLTIPIIPEDLPLLTEPDSRTDVRIDIQWKTDTFIVFTASCDLEKGRAIRYALIGRIVELEAALPSTDKSRDRRKKAEVLRRGLMPSKFRLASFDKIQPYFPDSVVDYRVHFTVPVEYLRQACQGQRLRLRPPFRESFGNWVGANISRVGIEDEDQIPPDRVGMSESALLELVDADGDALGTE